MVDKLILIFKFIEPIFWLAQIWITVNLIKPRSAFDGNLKVINWFIRCQGFDTQLAFADKAFKTWARDLKILFFLNLLVIVLIHLI